MRDYYVEIDTDGRPLGRPVVGTSDTPYDRAGRWVLLEGKNIPGETYDMITRTWT